MPVTKQTSPDVIEARADFLAQVIADPFITTLLVPSGIARLQQYADGLKAVAKWRRAKDGDEGPTVGNT